MWTLLTLLMIATIVPVRLCAGGATLDRLVYDARVGSGAGPDVGLGGADPRLAGRRLPGLDRPEAARCSRPVRCHRGASARRQRAPVIGVLRTCPSEFC